MHLDTQVVVWLYRGERRRFPPAADARLEAEPLAVSPMVLLELSYLHEIGRATQPGELVIDDLRQRLGVEIPSTSFAQVARRALSLTWTRDPFDRLIAAHAAAEQESLLTADQAIREHFDLAVWND